MLSSTKSTHYLKLLNPALSYTSYEVAKEIAKHLSESEAKEKGIIKKVLIFI